MRINVSAWSIRRPIPAIVAFAVLTILGLISFRTMSITRFPNIDIPIVQVLITQSGAAPSELESQVTKKVEDAVSSVNGGLAHHFDGHRRIVVDDRAVHGRLGRRRPRAQ